jgi:hypothetical protein
MLSEFSKKTPRVEACIESVMRRFPGSSPSSQARYFEEVHQHLGPLARQLEIELQRAVGGDLEQARAGQAEAWAQLTQAKRAAAQSVERSSKALAVATKALKEIRDSGPGLQSETAARALADIKAVAVTSSAAPSPEHADCAT